MSHARQIYDFFLCQVSSYFSDYQYCLFHMKADYKQLNLFPKKKKVSKLFTYKCVI